MKKSWKFRILQDRNIPSIGSGHRHLRLLHLGDGQPPVASSIMALIQNIQEIWKPRCQIMVGVNGKAANWCHEKFGRPNHGKTWNWSCQSADELINHVISKVVSTFLAERSNWLVESKSIFLRPHHFHSLSLNVPNLFFPLAANAAQKHLPECIPTTVPRDWC